MNSKARKITLVGMLCAMAYILVVLVRIPLVLFLEYEPKDVVITIGGLIGGPLTSFWVSLIVSWVEMLTISEDGLFGLIMNVLSSCSFACTAAWIYKKRRSLRGAVAGLLCGYAFMVATMLLWNDLIAPLYMGYPREAVEKLLLPAFLPFNLIKGGLNTAMTLLLYKPVITALRRAHLVESPPSARAGRLHFGVALASFLALAALILLALLLRGIPIP